MGYDYRKKLQPVGQLDSNACWAASLSWWLSAMASNYKCRVQEQLALIGKFMNLCESDGAMTVPGFRKVCESAEIRLYLQYMSPAKFQQDYTNIDSPLVIVFNYPVIGGTHMNVVFDQQGSTVACMEPFYPYPGEDGKRTGRYVAAKRASSAAADRSAWAACRWPMRLSRIKGSAAGQELRTPFCVRRASRNRHASAVQSA